MDGLFFNAPGQPGLDYSGNRYGMCTCDSCKTRFQAMYHRPLPSAPDADYNRFIAAAAQEITKNFAELIHSKRPKAGFFTYTEDYVDGTTSESNTAIGRGLPLWPYSASESVGRARDNQPSKMPINLSIGFVDIPVPLLIGAAGRDTNPPVPEHGPWFGAGIRSGRNARPGGSDGHISGPPRFQIQRGPRGPVRGSGECGACIAAVRRARWRRRARRRTGCLSRVLRILTEQHIPFAVSANPDLLKSRKFDLVIAPEGGPAGLDDYVQQGRPVADRGGARTGDIHGPNRKAVDRHSLGLLPHSRPRDVSASLKDTDLVFLDGEYLELEPSGKPPLTLIPPSMFGPPEKVHIDRVETEKPGLLLADRGKGKIAYIPWDIGGL